MTKVLVWAGGLLRDRRGSIAVKFALIVPVIALLSAGSIDLMAVSASRSRLQSIADNAALAGARSLTLAADRILAEQRAESLVEAEMSQWSGAPTYIATYTVTDAGDGRRLTVTLNGHRPSFFGSLLPPGGWHFSADATAAPVGQTPLCAIATGSGSALDGISTIGASRITAPDCMLHSNSNILTDNTGRITASAVQTVRGVTGTGISPAAGQGAVPIEDPFASMFFPSLDACRTRNSSPGQGNVMIYDNGGRYLIPPGLHCFPILVRNATTLILRPGEHFFYKDVSLTGAGKLIGDDVFLFFDHGSDPKFTGPDVTIDLVGRKSGPYAGMVMATIAGSQPDISIPGGRAKRLLGVVYARRGFLRVDGSGVAAVESDWTVMVANEIRLQGNASLRINADYENSDVPVPAGVGPNGGIMTGTRLSN